MASSNKEKVLAVFDFDRTIIDCNSDDWVAKLCPGGEPPKEIWDKYRQGIFMEAVEDLLKHLHDNGVSSQDILDVMRKAPYTHGMKDVLKFIGKNRDVFDCIVMSGTNELFLEAALKADEVDREVVSKIYTNYGHIDDKCDHSSSLEFLEHFLQYLPNNGVTPKHTLKFMAEAPYTDGMEDVLKFIGKNRDKFDCVIASAANTLFIEATLKARGLEHAVNKIYSNHGHVDDKGRIHVWAYHKHECTICSADICKGALLSEYVREQAQKGMTYAKVVYVGDGRNDICPCKGLGCSDVVMPRKGYKLLEIIEALTPENRLNAKVIPWEQGSDVLAVLESCL
ncbi:PHOSPHO2 [Branchiostoma lanceolatum]|uniref:PHOSPHO2 protein n=1 Tax=Branchiostoma lanceolatum TaxID=7740 RepID=A0A8J9VDP4_BRALA|nr:PHOSPHO2 [Branchiostoma lanceolatum]